jgi:cell division topological specificity factor
MPTEGLQPQNNKLVQWWVGLFQKLSAPVPTPTDTKTEITDKVDGSASAKDDAKNRLKLVLMHDRTQLSPSLLEDMRDELMEVISKYVEIDKTTMDLCLEQESNTIALVANIQVVRGREATS